MVKVLAKAGTSLADTYDVVGSVAGVETLLPEEVQVVHEMGATIFSERLNSKIERATTGDIAQNTNWNVTIDDFPPGAVRIIGVTVFGNGSGVNTISVNAADPTTGRETPIYVWETTADVSFTIRLSDDGGAVSGVTYFQPIRVLNDMPSMLTVAKRPATVQNITFRGTTSSFGGGTINLKLLVHILLAQTEGLSSYGLPIPGW